MESFTIFPWCQTDDTEEYFSTTSQITIADLPRNRVDRQRAELQQFPRLAYPKPLGIIGRSQTGRLVEPAQKSSLFHTRPLR